jgi:hypothetical protein
VEDDYPWLLHIVIVPDAQDVEAWCAAFNIMGVYNCDWVVRRERWLVGCNPKGSAGIPSLDELVPPPHAFQGPTLENGVPA